jgi:hypothetical protein
MLLGADVELDESQLGIGRHKMRNSIFLFFFKGRKKKSMENEKRETKTRPLKKKKEN